MDGAVVGHEDGGICKRILRDDKRSFLGSFAVNIENYFVIKVEVWGIYHGLNLAREANYARLLWSRIFVMQST